MGILRPMLDQNFISRIVTHVKEIRAASACRAKNEANKYAFGWLE